MIEPEDELDEELVDMLFAANKSLLASGMGSLSDHELKRKYEEIKMKKATLSIPQIPSLVQQAGALQGNQMPGQIPGGLNLGQ